VRNKIFKILLIIVVVSVGIAGMWMVYQRVGTGPRRSDVAIIDQVISEDGTHLSVVAHISTSAGFLKRYKIEKTVEDERALYIAFYQTPGLNNSYGAKNEFSIDVTDIDYVYYFGPAFVDNDGGYRLLWQRD